MALILFNPTNETLQTQYIGEDVSLAPGSKTRVDDARGRHVLNVLGPRGLTTLEYGDEGGGEAKKAAEGRERNMAFKRKQIMDFNVMNDQRTQAKQPYLTPSVTIRAYANELGIKLFEPYSTTDAAMAPSVELRAELERAKRENVSKDEAVSILQAQVAELTKAMGAFMLRVGTPDVAPGYWEEFARKFRSINGKHFASWVSDNWIEIESAPAEVKAEAADKYERLYKLSWPKSPSEARTAAVPS
jgi:hypothetical protein